MASNGKYSGGTELSSNTNIVSVKLGNGTWAYDSTWGVCETSVGNNVTPTFSEGIPTAGNYIVIKPAVDVVMTLDTRSSTNHNFVLVEATAPTTEIINVRGRYYLTYDLGTAASPLKANKTYYAYSKGGANLGYRAFTATSVESYTIHYVDNSSTPVTIKEDVIYKGLYGAVVTASEEDMAPVNYGENTYSYSSGNQNITLGTGVNEITLVYENVSAASYKIRYIDDSATPLTIKDEIEIESYAGAEVIASGDNFPTYITYNDTRYKYLSGNNALTVTGNANTDIITLVYTPCSTFAYTVKAYDGDNNLLTTLSSGSYLEGDNAISVNYPRYLQLGTTLYCSGSGTYTYNTAFTPNTDNYEQKVFYNTGTPVSNVTFYTEGEDISGVSEGSNAARASMGKMGYTGGSDSYVDVTTLLPGKYIIYLRGQNGNSNSRAFNFKVGENIVFTGTINNGTNTDLNSEEFTINETSTLSFATEGSSYSGIDYFYIIQTGVSATLGANGYTTFASPYPLDLAHLPEGLKAYTATLDGKNLSFQLCKQAVPAGTGLLLQGTGGETYNIPVVATFTTVDNNALTGVTAVTPLKSDETNYIFAMKKATNATDELLFAPLTSANNVNFPAGKAYITVPASAFGSQPEARALVLTFDDATSVKELKNSGIEELKAYYNLQGQRVASPKKGLYIVNGRKVQVK